MLVAVSFPLLQDFEDSEDGGWLQMVVIGKQPAIQSARLHHCEVVAINGPSYRLKNRLKAIERETEVA